jgi:hypothetical protein
VNTSAFMIRGVNSVIRCGLVDVISQAYTRHEAMWLRPIESSSWILIAKCDRDRGSITP